MTYRRKGLRGENELKDFLTANGFPAQRNDQRFRGGADNPDVAAEGLSAYHIECKRTERLNLARQWSRLTILFQNV